MKWLGLKMRVIFEMVYEWPYEGFQKIPHILVLITCRWKYNSWHQLYCDIIMKYIISCNFACSMCAFSFGNQKTITFCVI
jgi:hypothetical protein